MLNKIINEEIWKKYVGIKCSPDGTKGKTFEHNIYAGFMDQKSTDYLCATSADAYEKFSEIYDNFEVGCGKGLKEICQIKNFKPEYLKQKEFVCGGF